MAKIYASLIKKGLKTLEEVPKALRIEVERILADEDKSENKFSDNKFFAFHTKQRRVKTGKNLSL